MKHFTIYLDFDGTVVEHAYPELGAPNPGSIEIIRKLQQAGHTIILNTYRADIGNEALDTALNYLNQKEHNLHLLLEVTPYKIDPPKWDWEVFMTASVLFIDDNCSGTPLIENLTLKEGFMVDWNTLDTWFVEKGIYG